MQTFYLNINHSTTPLIWGNSATSIGPIYNLTQDEFVVFHEYNDKNIEKGFIWHSKFLACATIFLVKKRIGF